MGTYASEWKLTYYEENKKCFVDLKFNLIIGVKNNTQECKIFYFFKLCL